MLVFENLSPEHINEKVTRGHLHSFRGSEIVDPEKNSQLIKITLILVRCYECDKFWLLCSK
jgi:hypothetical protein